MTKKTLIETKTVTAMGYHAGRRYRPGETFNAPVDFEAKWFVGAEQAAEMPEPPAPVAVTTMTAAEVKEKAPSMTTQEINDAIDAEAGSQKRKNVLAILRDEQQNRVGKIDTPDPASKSSDEKDPITGGDDLLN